MSLWLVFSLGAMLGFVLGAILAFYWSFRGMFKRGHYW